MKQFRLLTLLVLLLTAATGAWAQTGMINGLFSISPTKRVYFSKGNLQYDGTNWKFAASQWEVLGANGTGATGTATNYPMDFFTWGNIDSPTYNGTTYYTENADLSGITDWGSRMGSGWYTLSKDEWLYLFGMESSNTDKSGHARYRKYFRATVNGVKGIVLLPDDLSGISDIPAESNRGTASNFAKTYTTDAWSAMESAGCVFLPTAGFRKTDASVSHVGWSGFYWESTAYDAGKAYTVGFDNTFVDPAGNFDRTFGFSVRLVIDQYYLTLADGTEDAGKWTATVGTSTTANPLPVGGLSEKDAVTLTYGGRLKVKSVTATTDAAPAFAADEYNEASWDDTNKKVVFEKKKATTTPVAVEDATANVTWGDGYYTVSGNVTITGNVTLTADAHLILQDGATLTINGQLNCRTNGKNLYIYGQKKGDGKLIVTNNSDKAINSKSNLHIDIHGGEVTASAAGDYSYGLYTGYLAVYGGKLTATSNSSHGIIFQNTIDVYGGEVEATSNATSGACYGFRSSSGTDNQILTVYGGKVTATGNGVSGMATDYGSGFGCHVKSGTSGIKFYFSADGTTWGDGTSYASVTKVGADDATKKRYAKAE